MGPITTSTSPSVVKAFDCVFHDVTNGDVNVVLDGNNVVCTCGIPPVVENGVDDDV